MDNLIEQAIESAKCRIYRLKVNSGSTLAHQKKAENQIELQKITIKALEKTKPRQIENWNNQACCPNCQKLFGNIDYIKKLVVWEMNYCKYCGQALDWKDIR